MAALRFRLAQAVRATQPPPIPLAKAWGAAYNSTPSKPLIDLSQGVPGIPPPQELLDAVADASGKSQYCGYGPMNGELAMRHALVEEMKIVYGPDADITKDDVSLTAGCNMGFMAVAMTLAEPGDEVILPVPWYFNHQMTLQMLGIRVVPLLCHASEGFLPSVSECANLITSRTRAIVLVTPNNPTGTIYPPEILSSFAALAKERGTALVVDETYRDLILSGQPHKLFGPLRLPHDTAWEWRTNFIHLFSFSKSYCVPGHRLGAVVASPIFLGQVNTVLDCMQICPPRPIQVALSPLLPKLRPFIRATAQSLVKRHELFRSILPRGWTVGSQGGYYAFVRHPFPGVSALEVSMKLAKDIGVVTLPASFFGPANNTLEAQAAAVEHADHDADRWIRFSVANVDDESLKKVGERLIQCEQTFHVVG